MGLFSLAGTAPGILPCRGRTRRSAPTRDWVEEGPRLGVERAVLRAMPPVVAADGVWKLRAGGVCVALPARPPAWQAWRLAPRGAAAWGGARSLAGHAASRGGGWRLEAPCRWRVCGSAGATAGMASLAACSTGSGGVASLADCATAGRKAGSVRPYF